MTQNKSGRKGAGSRATLSGFKAKGRSQPKPQA